MKRIASIALGSLLSLGLITLEMAAQSQTQSSGQSNSSVASQGTSLGDYARQIRKSSPNTEKPKVFDNDNLPKDDKLSVVGTPASGDQPPPADESSANSGGADKASTTKAAGEQPAAGQSSSQDKGEKEAAIKQWEEKIAAQKDSIDLMSRELDVLQKEYQLRAAAFYADAGNRLRNEAAWDQEDAKYKQEIADKQKAIDDAKQKLDDLQEEARKAGMPSSVSQQ
jgi:uncharacterized coiled-coil protein SlyX/cell division protein FtsL